VSGYLSYALELQASLRRILEILFDAEDFEPVAIGAIFPQASRADWMLAGAPLDDFVERLKEKFDVGSVRLAASGDARVADYLEAMRMSLVEGVAQPVPPPDVENIVRLDRSVAKELGEWASRQSHPVIYVYGRMRDGAHWKYLSEVGEPILVIRIGRSLDREEAWDLRLYSSAVHNLPSPELLRSIANLARELRFNGKPARKPDLHLEGSALREYASVIESALSG